MKQRYFALLLIFGIMFSSNLWGQEKKRDYRKLHYLSQEEMDMPFNAKRNFYETDPPEGAIRNVAEFDQMQAVLVRYPFGVPIELIREMAEETEVLTIVANVGQQQTVLDIYIDNNVDTSNCSFLYAQTDSYWVRDYGPWFVFDGNKKPGIVNFPYNRPRPGDNDIPIRVSEYLDIDLYGMNLSHTGGNYMCDGMGMAASTDLIWEENPDKTHGEIDTLVYDYLDIEEYDVRPDPLDEYIKHIDCWGKYLSPGKVLIGQVPENDYRYDDFEKAASFFASQISSYGKPYEVVRVFTPGDSPNTPYTNSLILNKKVLVPITGSQWDDEALDVYENAMPGYEIIGIMDDGWMNTDALHCRTKGVADIEMLYIKHVPLLGVAGYRENYEISADFIANSGEELYADSVLIYYSINGGDYVSSTMENEIGDRWTGSINGISLGDTVSYYLFGVDKAGKRAFHPFIGEPDPHEFVAVDELKLTPEFMLFLTLDDCLQGIPLDIVNITNDSVEIIQITEEPSENAGFYWIIEERPQLPLWLGVDDTLTLNILIDLPVGYTYNLLQDTLFVSTNNQAYSSLILVDSILTTGILQSQATSTHTVSPNPFNTIVNFKFKLEKPASVNLSIYDVKGQLVTQRSQYFNSGTRQINWDGKDESGQQLPMGYYFYKLQTGDAVFSGKVLLAR
jgi:agmatine/peptidylarginine deiminase